MKALIIVDMQKDFMPGGPMGIQDADLLVPLHNRLIEKFELVLATNDWHPPNHISFAVNHPGKKEGETLQTPWGEQILWKSHCVQKTEGAEFASGLNTEAFAKVFYKGSDPKVDSYSTFFDNAQQRSTGLEKYLKEHGIQEVVFAGVSTDYCILYSVCDAIDLGFAATVIRDACKGIELHSGDIENAWEVMDDAGALFLNSEEVL